MIFECTETMIKKQQMTAIDKYSILPDEFKTFSIKKVLQGVPLTGTEQAKVTHQVREFAAADDFWNHITEENSRKTQAMVR